jgi:ubiquinone/menaquinone biosynthesis C-methylase UbiE
MSEGWESRAQQWLGWARTPGHDAYWYYRDAFFALVPPPAGPVLEVGCGEGRVARDLRHRGFNVAALDASPTLLAAAKEADPDGTYVQGDALALPFADATFDLVVAYNSLMDVEDMPRAVAEAARVLTPDGRLCACVTHPVNDVGGWEDGRFVLERSYLESSYVDLHFERDGLTMRFDGLTYSVEDYARALESAGMVIEALREPRPSSSAPEYYAPWAEVPMFLMLRAGFAR